MKLKLLQSMAGIDFSHTVGDIIEVNDAEAVKRYVERGIAEIVKTTKKETAAKKTAAKEIATKNNSCRPCRYNTALSE